MTETFRLKRIFLFRIRRSKELAGKKDEDIKFRLSIEKTITIKFPHEKRFLINKNSNKIVILSDNNKI